MNLLAAHSARQSQTTTAGFSGFFEVGMGGLFLEIESEKEAHSTQRHAPVVCVSRGRGDPDGRVSSHDRAAGNLLLRLGQFCLDRAPSLL
jgi:hypothetical protein